MRSANLKAEYHQALDDQVFQIQLEPINLTLQVKAKLVERPPSPTQPIFGVYDNDTSVQMAKQKEKDQEIFKHQLAAVANKQELLKSQIMKMKIADAERLQKNKQEYIYKIQLL